MMTENMKEKQKFLLEAVMISGILHLIIALYFYFSRTQIPMRNDTPGYAAGFFQNIVYLVTFGSFLIGIFWIYYSIEYLSERRKNKK